MERSLVDKNSLENWYRENSENREVTRDDIEKKAEEIRDNYLSSDDVQLSVIATQEDLEMRAEELYNETVEFLNQINSSSQEILSEDKIQSLADEMKSDYLKSRETEVEFMNQEEIQKMNESADKIYNNTVDYYEKQNNMILEKEMNVDQDQNNETIQRQLSDKEIKSEAEKAKNDYMSSRESELQFLSTYEIEQIINNADKIYENTVKYYESINDKMAEKLVNDNTNIDKVIDQGKGLTELQIVDIAQQYKAHYLESNDSSLKSVRDNAEKIYDKSVDLLKNSNKMVYDKAERNNQEKDSLLTKMSKDFVSGAGDAISSGIIGSNASSSNGWDRMFADVMKKLDEQSKNNIIDKKMDQLTQMLKDSSREAVESIVSNSFKKQEVKASAEGEKIDPKNKVSDKKKETAKVINSQEKKIDIEKKETPKVSIDKKNVTQEVKQTEATKEKNEIKKTEEKAVEKSPDRELTPREKRFAENAENNKIRDIVNNAEQAQIDFYKNLDSKANNEVSGNSNDKSLSLEKQQTQSPENFKDFKERITKEVDNVQQEKYNEFANSKGNVILESLYKAIDKVENAVKGYDPSKETKFNDERLGFTKEHLDRQSFDIKKEVAENALTPREVKDHIIDKATDKEKIELASSDKIDKASLLKLGESENSEVKLAVISNKNLNYEDLTNLSKNELSKAEDSLKIADKIDKVISDRFPDQKRNEESNRNQVTENNKTIEANNNKSTVEAKSPKKDIAEKKPEVKNKLSSKKDNKVSKTSKNEKIKSKDLKKVSLKNKAVEKPKVKTIDEYKEQFPNRQASKVITQKEMKDNLASATNERNSKIEGTAEHKIAQTKFMNANAVLRNGVSQSAISGSVNSKVSMNKITQEKANGFIEKSIQNADGLVKAGILQNMGEGNYNFVDEKAKELLHNNLDKTPEDLEKINLKDYKDKDIEASKEAEKTETKDIESSKEVEKTSEREVDSKDPEKSEIQDKVEKAEEDFYKNEGAESKAEANDNLKDSEDLKPLEVEKPEELKDEESKTDSKEEVSSEEIKVDSKEESAEVEKTTEGTIEDSVDNKENSEDKQEDSEKQTQVEDSDLLEKTTEAETEVSSEEKENNNVEDLSPEVEKTTEEMKEDSIEKEESIENEELKTEEDSKEAEFSNNEDIQEKTTEESIEENISAEDESKENIEENDTPEKEVKEEESIETEEVLKENEEATEIANSQENEEENHEESKEVEKTEEDSKNETQNEELPENNEVAEDEKKEESTEVEKSANEETKTEESEASVEQEQKSSFLEGLEEGFENPVSVEESNVLEGAKVEAQTQNQEQQQVSSESQNETTKRSNDMIMS